MAAQTEELEIMNTLLSDNRTKIDQISTVRGTALHLAAKIGSFKAC
jgi:hypothetical protein